MGNLKLIALAVVLTACTPNQLALIDAADAAAETKVDATIVRGINRACRGPVDIMMRAVATYPALLPFILASCPETYGRLYAAIEAQRAARPATIEDLQRFLATQ